MAPPHPYPHPDPPPRRTSAPAGAFGDGWTHGRGVLQGSGGTHSRQEPGGCVSGRFLFCFWVVFCFFFVCFFWGGGGDTTIPKHFRRLIINLVSYCSSKQRSGGEKGLICQGKTHRSLSFILISYPGWLLFGVSGGPGPSITLPSSSELSPPSGSLSAEWENPNFFSSDIKMGHGRVSSPAGGCGGCCAAPCPAPGGLSPSGRAGARLGLHCL